MNQKRLDAITKAFKNQQFIALIKEYRDETGLGLKDAKDKLDEAFDNKRYDDSTWSPATFEKVVELFSNSDNSDNSGALKAAIDCMYQNWQILGYSSFRHGVASVIERI